MSSALAYAEKREFGRRESDIRGQAVLPGHTRRPFTISDISEGGARLTFDVEFVPPDTFKIEIDGTQFALLCETRHHGRHGIGIQFVRRREGAALYRHFLMKPIESVKDPAAQVPPRVVEAKRAIGNRALREALGLIGKAGAPAADGTQPIGEVAAAEPAATPVPVSHALT